EQNARRHVGAVREAGGNDLARVELILFRGGGDERDEILRSSVEVLDVENTLGQPSKKSGGAIFENGSAWTQQSGVGGQHLAKLDEIVLVAAGAVKKKQRAAIIALWRQVAVDVCAESVGHVRAALVTVEQRWPRLSTTAPALVFAQS